MPVTSAPQYGLMQAVAHGQKPRGGHGPSPAVAREFIAATPPEKRRAFAREVGRRLARHRSPR